MELILLGSLAAIICLSISVIHLARAIECMGAGQ